MPKPKPYADEPGHYRSALTPAGWVVLLDYGARLRAGGSPLLSETQPWVLWHPETNVAIGISNRQAGADALEGLKKGVDTQGLITLVAQATGGADSSQKAPEGTVCVDAQADVLAPARARAGEGFEKHFMTALQERFQPDQLFDRLEDAMLAESPFASNGITEYRPDWSARLKALDMAFAYQIGRPIERQQIISSNAPMSFDDLKKLAQNSPVFRETLISMLRDLEAA